MTSWKCKAQLLLLVLLSTIDLSYGGCAEYFRVEKWKENITQKVTLVETEDPQDIAECTWEKVYRANNTSAWPILRDCFSRKNRSDIHSEKCERQTFGTMPYYHFMCLTIAAINHNNAEEKIEAKQCEYDAICRLLSGGPSTATPTTLPERTVATPTTTTTELPPTTTNFTQNTGLNQSTTLPLTQPERTTSAVPPKVTQPSSSPPTTATTKTELPPTTTNFTQTDKQLLFKEKEATENLALKIFSVVSATLNIAALMVFLYQRKSNPGLSHESVSNLLDRASLEAQPMAALKSSTVSAPVGGNGVETACLIKPPEPDSISAHSPLTPNGCPVGNEE